MAWNLQGSLNPPSIQTAGSVNMVAWTGDPALFPSSLAPAAGVIYFVRAYVDNPQTCTHMYTAVKTAGSGLSGCYLGVYQATSGGSRLGVTADISTSLQSTGSVTVSLSSSITGLAYNQEVWLAILCSSGTPPTLIATRQYGANINQSADYRIWKSSSGSQTSLPTTAPAMTNPALGFYFLGVGA